MIPDWSTANITARLSPKSLQRFKQGRVLEAIRVDRPKKWQLTADVSVALGKFREAATGSIEPRSVLILVEWESKEAFDSYCSEPNLADLHPYRTNGTDKYIWHLFDKLEDLRSILKSEKRWIAGNEHIQEKN